MAYQVKTKTSYGQRVKNSFGGIGTGILLLIIGTVLLWWNEGRAVKTTKMLKEAQTVAIHVNDVSVVNPELNGKLIHANAMVQTGDYLKDPTFGIKAQAIKLQREVSWYQWIESSSTETKDKVGGAQEKITTYDYKKGWSSKPVESSEFADPSYRGLNTVIMNIKDEEWQAEDVTFGAYRLPKEMIDAIPCNQPLDIAMDPNIIIELNRGIQKMKNDSLMVDFVHIKDNSIYLGRYPQEPEIGDMRITFTVAINGDASILAQVNGGTFTSFTGKNGKTLSSITTGTRSMDEMFESEHQTNKILLWVFRVLGILLIIGGFKGIFNILVTLLKVLPPLAAIGSLGTSLVCNVVGFIWALLIIILAWVTYRPILAITLLVVVVALIVLLCNKAKKSKTSI